MDTKKNIVIVISLLIVITSVLSQCGKVDCSKNSYRFEVSVKAYPDKDTIMVGDTLWIEINAPVTLTDIETRNLIDYSGAINLGSSIAFTRDTSSTGYIKAANKFFYSLKKGSETKNADPDLYREYHFDQIDGRYIFLLGVIPKEKGTYGIIVSNSVNVYRKKDKCTKASFAINFKNTDQHYYLNPNYHGGPVAPGGDYYFVVK